MKHEIAFAGCALILLLGLAYAWRWRRWSALPRTGALIVVFAILAESWSILKTPHADDLTFWSSQSQHTTLRVAVILVCFGTLLQGLGDLIPQALGLIKGLVPPKSTGQGGGKRDSQFPPQRNGQAPGETAPREPPWTLVIPLLRFHCARDVVLQPGIRIANDSDHLPRLFGIYEQKHAGRLQVLHQSMTNFLLVSRRGNPPTELNKMREEVRVAEEVLLRLRLLKRGPAGFRTAAFVPGTINHGPVQAAAHFLTLAHYVVWERAGDPQVYDLVEEDVSRLERMWAATGSTALLSNVAYRSFFRAFHEPYASDRFFSNAIGLEAFLLRGDSELSVLTYKLALRGAVVLARATGSRPDEIFRNLKEIYGRRSQIAHGSAREEDWTDETDIAMLVRTEDYLRACLRYALDHPDIQQGADIDQLVLESIGGRGGAGA